MESEPWTAQDDLMVMKINYEERYFFTVTGAGYESSGNGAVETLILPYYVSINCSDVRWVIDLD